MPRFVSRSATRRCGLVGLLVAVVSSFPLGAPSGAGSNAGFAPLTVEVKVTGTPDVTGLQPFQQEFHIVVACTDGPPIVLVNGTPQLHATIKFSLTGAPVDDNVARFSGLGTCIVYQMAAPGPPDETTFACTGTVPIKGSTTTAPTSDPCGPVTSPPPGVFGGSVTVFIADPNQTATVKIAYRYDARSEPVDVAPAVVPTFVG